MKLVVFNEGRPGVLTDRGVVDILAWHAASRSLANLVAGGIEECGNLKPFVAESRVVCERKAKVTGAHDRDANGLLDAENLPQVASEFLDIVADASNAKLAKIGEILANLRRVEVELLGEGA